MIRSAKIRNLKISCVSLFIAFVSSIAFGQGGVATGDLHVTVKDPNGSLVANAKVTVSDVAKGVERAATSDGQGGYSCSTPSAGNLYRYGGSTGFGKVEAKDVNITVGGVADLPVVLAIASGKEVVEVSSQAD